MKRCFFSGTTMFALFALVSFQPTAAADAPPPAQIPQTGPINTGLRVFTCGHSFHLFIPKLLPEIAATAGIQGHTIVGVSGIGGSPAIKHWEVPDDKNEAKKALIAGNVDVLTLSCMTHPDEGIANFAKLGFEHNPNIRVTIQEIWIPQDKWPFLYSEHINHSPADFNKSTVDDMKKAYDPYAKEMQDYVAALNKSLGKQVVFTVPDGAAAIALREKIIAGTAPGLKQQSDLFGDWWGHPKEALRLLSGYCHYAVIYRRSPVGLPAPPSIHSLDKGLVLLLQQLAWDAVIHDPLSGVTAN
jgi:hypothetical protein